MKIERILVPIDFSEQSQVALEEADSIAAERGAELTLLHVYQITQIAILDFTFVDPAPKVASSIQAAETKLRDMAKTLRTPEARRYISVETGQPIQVILERSLKHDLIVMPTHGRTGPSHFLLGSVAERVVQAAKCSVLVVKGRTAS